MKKILDVGVSTTKAELAACADGETEMPTSSATGMWAFNGTEANAVYAEFVFAGIGAENSTYSYRVDGIYNAVNGSVGAFLPVPLAEGFVTLGTVTYGSGATNLGAAGSRFADTITDAARSDRAFIYSPAGNSVARLVVDVTGFYGVKVSCWRAGTAPATSMDVWGQADDKQYSRLVVNRPDLAVVGETGTLTSTQTFTDTLTKSDTNTDTVTASLTQTATDTATLTKTKTDTDTATASLTKTATDTNTNSLTKTQTGTMTETSSLTKTDTLTKSDTDTLTKSKTDTLTKTLTITESGTRPIPTWTATKTKTDTDTLTNTQTDTLTKTYTNTHSGTATKTDTDTLTLTKTKTATDTNTGTLTKTKSDTDTATATKTVTATDTGTNTKTLTKTDTISKTMTGTT